MNIGYAAANPYFLPSVSNGVLRQEYIINASNLHISLWVNIYDNNALLASWNFVIFEDLAMKMNIIQNEQ